MMGRILRVLTSQGIRFAFLITGIGVIMLAACRTVGVHETSQQKSMTKELRSDQYSVRLEVPPIVFGQQTTVAMRLVDLHSGTPVSGADPQVRIQQTPAVGGETHEMPLAASELRAEEGPEPGLYRLTHRFDGPGKYDVTISVQGMKDPKAQAVSFATTMDLDPPPSKQSDRFSRLAILGGVGAAACMVLMMAVMGALLLL